MKQTKWLSVGFGMVLLAALVVLRAQDGFVPQTIRNLAFDQYQRLAPRVADPGLPVRVVDIDEASLARLGQFPWPRTYLANLVNNLRSLGAAAIAFDILFAEPDRLSPARIMSQKDISGKLPTAALRSLPPDLPDNDEIFAAAIASAPVVLAIARSDIHPDIEPVQKSGYAFTGSATLAVLHDVGPVTPVLAGLEKPASGIGIISISPSGNQQVVRKYPLVWARNGKAFPSLALEALRVAQNESTIIVRGAETEHGAVEKISVGQLSVQTSRKGELWLHYARNNPALYVPAYKLVKPAKGQLAGLREKIAGHIVLIGTSAAGLFDVKTSSLGETLPGVAVHAQALQQILSQDFLWRPDWLDGIEVLVILVFGLVVVLASVFLSPAKSLLAAGVIATGTIAGSWFSFSRYGLLLDVSFPLFSFALVLFAMTAWRYLVTDRQARFVRTAFSRYVSPQVLREIRSHPETLMLGGDTRPMTIMFMDIRNFTPLSEALTPNELVGFLNTLLGELSACVIAHGGTIDKYIGDSIMAFWNAPLEVTDHAAKACAAALAMRETLARLNARDAFGFREKGYDFAEIAIGIGINTGPACVGNLGSAERFDYSVVGDAVNLAARAEASCKQLAADIVVTAATANAIAKDFAVLDAGTIALKGKSEPQKVFALAGNRDLAQNKDFQRLACLCKAFVDDIDGDDKKADIETIPTLAAKVSPPMQAFCARICRQGLTGV